MITFKILRTESGNKTIQVRYSTEGKPDYFVRANVNGDWTEENILNEAKADHNVDQAALYWSGQAANPDVELTTDTGQLKDRVFGAQPTHDPYTQRVVKTTSEDDTTVTHSFVVEDLSGTDLEAMIRNQRDRLLASTDNEMLTDRAASDEMTAYRQALRDLPQQEGFPTDVQWPTRPVE